jgi:hypothetical protein
MKLLGDFFRAINFFAGLSVDKHYASIDEAAEQACTHCVPACADCWNEAYSGVAV